MPGGLEHFQPRLKPIRSAERLRRDQAEINPLIQRAYVISQGPRTAPSRRPGAASADYENPVQTLSQRSNWTANVSVSGRLIAKERADLVHAMVEDLLKLPTHNEKAREGPERA